MKLGTETNSFFNWMMSANSEAPSVDKGATILHWTDRTAYFVNWVSEDGKKVKIERAEAIRTDNLGMSDAQHYRYERSENAYVEELVFRYGAWYHDAGKGSFADQIGQRFAKKNVVFGMMQAYHDYSF